MDKETNIQRVENMIYYTCGCSKEEGLIILEECLKRNNGTKKLFNEIDSIIESCKSEKPVPFGNSKFKKLYEELKKRYETKEN
jgi:hypothetical protein